MLLACSGRYLVTRSTGHPERRLVNRITKGPVCINFAEMHWESVNKENRIDLKAVKIMAITVNNIVAHIVEI